ncbi:MAG: CvpA family protein [Patescibacteria group bacterium]|nr:CvpA family protein [Patescibacteria group bacterium]
MSIFDIILIIIIAGFVFYGLFFGLIRTFGSLVGVVLGLWLTFVFYLTVFDWVKNLFFGHEAAGKIVTFIILFTLINRLIGFIFAVLDRTFDLLSVIPFLKTINRLAGAILGFLEGGLILGLIFAYLANTSYAAWFDNSQVVPFLIKFTKTVLPLIPPLMEKIKGAV